jgi:ribosome biogenesis GTPase A
LALFVLSKLRTQGGEPDVDTVAKMVLYDWQRGKVPWFSPPPFREEEEQAGDAKPESGVKEEVRTLSLHFLQGTST